MDQWVIILTRQFILAWADFQVTVPFPNNVTNNGKIFFSHFSVIPQNSSLGPHSEKPFDVPNRSVKNVLLSIF